MLDAITAWSRLAPDCRPATRGYPQARTRTARSYLPLRQANTRTSLPGRHGFVVRHSADWSAAGLQNARVFADDHCDHGVARSAVGARTDAGQNLGLARRPRRTMRSPTTASAPRRSQPAIRQEASPSVNRPAPAERWPPSKEAMLRIAEDYERLAKRAEERAKRSP